MPSTFVKPKNLTFSFSEVYNFENKILFDKKDIDTLFEKYWIEIGEAIVLETWNKIYADYIVDIDSNKTHTKSDICEEQKEEIYEEISEYSKDWEALWSEHWQEQQIYVYNLFKENYHKEFDPEIVKEQLEIEEVHIVEIDELELKKLGLPTSFVSRNSRGNFENCEDSTSSEEDEELEIMSVKEGKVKKKGKSYDFLKNAPEIIQQNKKLIGYWKKRFSLFSKFDKGIRLDEESWYSVTPENIAKKLAQRIKCDTIVDAFCGCGGNSIQFAKSGKRVIAIDIDEEKIKNAKHNAQIYNVQDKIEFIIGDFFHLYEHLKADAVFLSPPWGGVDYVKCLEYDIETQLKPVGADILLEKCRKISEDIAIFLPRNSNTKQIVKLAGIGKQVEIEKNFLDRRFVGITAFYGNLIKSD